jgi:hypothetical protein
LYQNVYYGVVVWFKVGDLVLVDAGTSAGFSLFDLLSK